MSASATRTVSVVRAVVDGVRSDQVTFIAASLAYYAFISLIPLLLLALAVSTALGFDVAIERAVIDAVGAEAAAPIVAALSSPAGQGGATLVGGLVLVWSALKLFRGLDVAFSTVYPAEPGGFVDQLTDAVVTLIAVAGGIAVTVLVGLLIALPGVVIVIGGVDIIGAVGTVATLAGLSLVFLPLYYLLPETDVSLREALPGAAFAALGWTLLQLGFGVYSTQASTSAYGVIGGVLLLVTFLYFGALVLLVGLVLNAVLAGRMGEATHLDALHTTMAHDDSRSTASPTDSDATTPPPDDGDGDGDGDGPPGTGVGESPRDDQELEAQLERLRQQLREFEREVDERTVHRDDLEADMKRYVRRRVRRGKARGWGPYLVLGYGTAMTLGAFYFIQSGLFAVLAMLVIWLSTLGLYVLFLIVGVGLGAAGVPTRVYERLREFRR